jgi:hypothetical protein
MKYSLKYFEGNPHGLSISVSKLVSEGSRNYAGPGQNKGIQPEVVKELFGLTGIGAITTYPYEVYVRKGEVFEWKDLVQPILDILLKNLDPDGKLEWAKPAVMKARAEDSERKLSDDPTYPDPGAPLSKNSIPTGVSMDELEKCAIIGAIEECNGNRTAAAKKLGVSARTLKRKLHKHGLEKSAAGDSPWNDNEAPSVLKAEAERESTPGAGDLRWQQFRDGD